MDIKNIPNPCSNCGGRKFIEMKDGQAVILKGDRDEKDNYKVDHSKLIGIIPIICDSCGLIMLFHADKLKDK